MASKKARGTRRGSGSAFPGVSSGWTDQPKWGMTRNEMVWVSTRPVIVTVYTPTAIPVVSMLTLTVPLPSGPVTTGACTVEWCPVPVTVTVTSSQVCPGTVEVGSANGGPVTPNCPGSAGDTPTP